MKMKGKEKQKMRRFTALLLSLMLICAMSMTAFATDGSSDGSGTVTDGSGNNQKVDLSKHSFKAYQIFKGDFFNGKLSNIEWGADANEGVKSVIAETLKVDANADLAVFLTALEGVKNESKVANDLAAAIASKLDMKNGGTPVDGSTENLDHGYYIVIDTTDGEDLGTGESKNFALLQCTNGKIEIKTKTGTVSSDKKVMDVNDSVYEPTIDWDTSADYDIGDEVPFELTGTVAENYDMYQEYEFVFHDKESAGLSFNKDSVKVTIDGKQIDSGYEVVTEGLEDGDTFHVKFADLKTIEGVGPGSVIKISYTSTLTENAVIGLEGNDNIMYLEYSNNPSGGGTGKTPENKVIVFTYKVQINKVNEKEEPLAGAEFALYKADPSYTGINDNPFKDDDNYKKYNKPAGIYTVDEATKFSFKGIDDGEYLLVETKTPDGYNSIKPVAFTVTAEHDGLTLKDLNGETISGEVQLDFGDNSADSGTLVTDVMNKSGSLLPSTGGIGTTMFYIIGGILMVGACMMLFVRKIMTNEKR